MSGRILVVDASAARVGGGATDVRQLGHSLPALAPANRYEFYVRAEVAREIGPTPGVRFRSPPTAARPYAARVLWQHFVLPRLVAKTDADWLLAPFNVLPRGPGFGPRVKKAVMFSNVLPFLPETWSAFDRRQRFRLRALRALTLGSFRHADLVFVRSEVAYRFVASSLDRSRTVFLPPTPPGPALLGALSETHLPAGLEEVPFFVAVGDFWPHKGIEDALGAMAILAQEGVRALLVVCGAPLDQRYAQQLHQLAAASPGIRFLGRTSQLTSLALMQASLATVVTSRIENPGLVFTEAMTVGSPVIATDVPSSREACGDAAAYYPPGDHTSLALRMKDLLAGEGRDRMIQRGHKRLAGLDWTSSHKKMLESMELM